jgi:hypothetical protein
MTAGLISGADLTLVNGPLSEDDRARLVRLATFASRCTAVERDGYAAANFGGGAHRVVPQMQNGFGGTRR